MRLSSASATFGRLEFTLMASLAAACFLPSARSFAGAAVKLANHPTSPQTAYPALNSAREFQGRVYFSYGDWNDYVATALVSYEPKANVLAVEHSVSSDSVEMMREIDGTLYVPHCDPVHHEDFHDYSYRLPDGRWRQSAALEQLHVFDFAGSEEGLFCAANGLWRSQDQGRTWTLLTDPGDSNRWYWCVEQGGKILSRSGAYASGGFDPTATQSMPETWCHLTALRDPVTGNSVTLGMDNKTPGIGAYGSRVSRVLGNGLQSVRSNSRHFAVDGANLYVLASPALAGQPPTIVKSEDVASSPTPTFTALDISGIPANASCLELIDGKLIIGTTTGEIWIANADGSEIAVTPPTVENQLYDAFGRGLAFSGGTLVVGAPDAQSTNFLAGRAEVWRRDGGAWRKQDDLTPPVPDYSGWFGKDVAVHGDLLAVVEAGHDLSGRDRGSNAKVHVLQRLDDHWTLRHTFTVAFAQSVAFQDDLLVVGTSNQAANQANGRPGVIPYPITRDAQNLATLTALPQLAPRSAAYGYKALVRVALMGDLLIAGFSSDPSRGATGLLSIYRRNGPGFAAAPVQEIAVSTNLFRFGFAVSADEGWVAVGAPFDDTGAKNTGAVALYQLSPNSPPEAPLIFRQAVYAPSPQAHAEFGAAVALNDGLLLVGCPGREVGGVRQRGAVYRFRLQESNNWIPMGELDPPTASETEFGIEVAASAEWQAAGSLGSASNVSTLSSRVRLVPRSGYEEWLDDRLVATAREPLDDGESDGLPNLLEYVFNLHPLTTDLPPAAMGAGEPTGVPHLPPSPPAGIQAFTFVRPIHDPRITVITEFSDTLEDWVEAPGVPVVLETGLTHELVSLTVNRDGAHRWWRVRASYSSD